MNSQAQRQIAARLSPTSNRTPAARVSPNRTPPERPPPPRLSSRASNSASRRLSDVKTYIDFKSLSDAVHQSVDAALLADEEGDKDKALQSYLKSQNLIDIALSVNCNDLTDCSGSRREQATSMQQKMNKTKQQVFYRIQELRPSGRQDQVRRCFFL